jgi:23S rRNA (cytosine1962-C5)-methyltransferase
MKTVRLKRNEERRIKRGHLWIYSNEIQEPLKNYEPGELVDVYDFRGHFVGRGYINPHSLICIRILSSHQEEIDGNFFRKRIENAFEYRRRIVQERDFYRLVFSEGDSLPGLIIDRYGDHFVLQTTTAGMDRQIDLVGDALEELFQPQSITIRNDIAIRGLEHIPQEKSMLKGTLEEPLVLESGDVKFDVHPLEAQKTGLYLDQWENYQRLKSYFTGNRVFDCFCYTGGWALHAVRCGAQKVKGVDSSEAAIRWAQRNAELNHASDACHFRVGDAFEALTNLETKKERFDCVILDPPAFVKSKSKLKEGLKGYYEINRRAMRILSPRSLLVTCSCSHHVDRNTFLTVLRKAAVDARKKIRIIDIRTQAPDHPILLSMPETEYLKCVFLEVE